jgi:hypothetical protein
MRPTQPFYVRHYPVEAPPDLGAKIKRRRDAIYWTGVVIICSAATALYLLHLKIFNH